MCGDREIFKDVLLLERSNNFDRVEVIFIIFLDTLEVGILNILLSELIINFLALNFICRDWKIIIIITAFEAVFLPNNVIQRLLNLMSIIIVFS